MPIFPVRLVNPPGFCSLSAAHGSGIGFATGEDSPWYPRVHLKRRTREQSWTDLVAATVPEIEAALARL